MVLETDGERSRADSWGWSAIWSRKTLGHEQTYILLG